MDRPAPSQEMQRRVVDLHARRPDLSERALARCLGTGREVVAGVMIRHGLKRPRPGRPYEAALWRTPTPTDGSPQ